MTRKKQTDAGHMVDLSRIDPDKMYTRTEAGDLLGCSSSSIREYGRRDMLTEVRQGYFLRIAGADLIAIGEDINKAGGFKLWAAKRQAESKSNTAVLSKDSIAVVARLIWPMTHATPTRAIAGTVRRLWHGLRRG